ncbi:hypothetical protein [Dactylosporangium aurantiacum]|uniref:hypothetical protein n=1 Tax=Dactylosporangium aurantiacum TaxID=35754 RepID=UPI0021B36005|nr:hypothetical protein [Dactylosporangium aurantiacum]
MTALVRMRLAGFVQTGRAAAPLLAALVVLSILYGGGQAQAGEAYGVSAAILFAVLAWQTKILLDVEPDVQRRLGRVALGTARETAAGVVAALLAGLPVILVALVLPWLVGGVTTPGRGDPPLAEGVALGVWAHLLLLLPAVALGALSSRAVSVQTARGLAVLVGGRGAGGRAGPEAVAGAVAGPAADDHGPRHRRRRRPRGGPRHHRMGPRVGRAGVRRLRRPAARPAVIW